jgi:hypothetical protein
VSGSGLAFVWLAKPVDLRPAHFEKRLLSTPKNPQLHAIGLRQRFKASLVSLDSSSKWGALIVFIAMVLVEPNRQHQNNHPQ